MSNRLIYARPKGPGNATSRTPGILSTTALMWLCSQPALTTDIYSIEVARQGAAYTVTVDAIVTGTSDQVVRVLTDYERWPILNNSIIESTAVHDPDSGMDTVRSTTSVCILVFCRVIKQTQKIEKIDDTTIIARTIPQDSDFSVGVIRWKIESSGIEGNSRVRVDAQLTPAFWIPPIIGPYAVQHVLERESKKTLAALQRYANSAVPVN